MQTREQEYPYSFKTVTGIDLTMCNRKLYFRLIPPDELLQHKGLHTTFICVFDPSVAAAARVIRSIGIGSERPPMVENTPAIYKKVTLNKVADVNRRVEINIDLTPLVLPNNDNFVVIELDDTLLNVTNLGTVKLWKIDELFTTRGIR